MLPLSMHLKKAAVLAFRINVSLSQMSPQEREQAAQWYEDYAAETGGILSDLARLYNLERVKFLRGEVERIAHSAPKFAEEISYQRKGETDDTQVSGG